MVRGTTDELFSAFMQGQSKWKEGWVRVQIRGGEGGKERREIWRDVERGRKRGKGWEGG